jgi:hypothetical protein
VTICPRVIFAVCAASLIGCAGREPEPRLDAVEPTQAYTDHDIRLVLTGADFVPSFRVDPLSGERVATVDGFSGRVGVEPNWAPLTEFGWAGTGQISATLLQDAAEDLAKSGAVLCDVEITDPRGNSTALLRQGISLQIPDADFPELIINSPDPNPPDPNQADPNQPYAPGGTIHGDVVASTPPPGHMTELTWSYSEPSSGETEGRTQQGHCAVVLGESKIACTFDITIDKSLQAGDNVTLRISASHDAPPADKQNISQKISIILSAKPTVTSVTPAVGGYKGGTNVVIRGSGFIVGSRVYFGNDLISPDGGILIDKGTIAGYAPAHPVGPATVTVRSRLGLTTSTERFQYQLPPQIEKVVPSSAVQGEMTAVSVFGTNFSASTLICLGPDLASATCLLRALWVNDKQIDGVVPSLPSPATVWAFDVNNGWTSLPDYFSWIEP